MDQSLRGNFIAFLNRDKQPGDNKPAFDGRLSVPGSDEELRLALWAHDYINPKTGEVQIMFNGQTGLASTTAAPMEQVAALLRQNPEQAGATLGNVTLAARQVVLFPNGFKADSPDKDRPDYWGAFNPGDGSPLVRISAWAKKDRNHNAMLAGATSYPIPGKSEAQQQDASPPMAEPEAKGGMPEKARKTRSGR